MTVRLINFPLEGRASRYETRASMLGLFIHFGPYSVYGYDDLTSTPAPQKRGAEWFLQRLLTAQAREADNRAKGVEDDPKKRFPIREGRWEGAVARFKDIHGEDDFATADSIKRAYFTHGGGGLPQTSEKAQAVVSSWFDLLQKIGGKTLIFTAKHHDGWCMWPTKTTPLRTEVNWVELVKNEATRRDLQFGFYFSWYEFGKSCTVDFIEKTLLPQICELVKYYPDIMWFDGSWEMKTTAAAKAVGKVCEGLQKKLIEFNDRLHSKPGLVEIPPTFKTFEQTFPVEVDEDTPIECLHTVGQSWGHVNGSQRFKTGVELKAILAQATEKGCFRTMFNIGPMGDGTIDPREATPLVEAFA